MYSPSDFRKGLRLVVDNQPYIIVDFQHFQMGRGRANIRTKLRHLKTGSIVEKVFGSNDVFDTPDVETKTMQYLYAGGDEYTFMDTKTFDQLSIRGNTLGDTKWYLIENHEYQIFFLDNEPLSLDLPASVILKVMTTEPVVRGDTVTNITKPAILQTGLIVKVPPFVKEGDSVKVDTRTNEYLERALV
ncbi:MAG: elongation factor P, partial [Candidatus Zixiibacteriota bacterium]